MSGRKRPEAAATSAKSTEVEGKRAGSEAKSSGVEQLAKRPRGRPALPRQQQRERLLEAANRVFESKGYEGARVADIVREAGMSSRSFYELFDSKADLVAEVVQSLSERFLQRWDEIVQETDDLALRMDRGLRAYLELFRVAHVDLEHLGGQAGQMVREIRRATVRDVTVRMLDALQGAYERGELQRPPDPVRVELLFTGIEGLSFRYYSDDRREALRSLHPALMAIMTEALLENLTPRPSS